MARNCAVAVARASSVTATRWLLIRCWVASSPPRLACHEAAISAGGHQRRGSPGKARVVEQYLLGEQVRDLVPETSIGVPGHPYRGLDDEVALRSHGTGSLRLLGGGKAHAPVSERGFEVLD